MAEKLLFVDDEPCLLNGIARRLGFDYAVVTADSGARGLEAIAVDGPFAAVFADMRMPHMDGVEFIEQARTLAPDTVFVMLTGSQDQATAIRAVNRGRVFRFLTKPCADEELDEAVLAALRPHQLLCAEKELLQRTFIGAVRVLTEVLEVVRPDGADLGDRIERKVEALRRALSVEDRWEFRLAARLSPVGFALLPESDRNAVQRASVGDPAGAAALARGAHLTSRLVREIPRLASVAEICDPVAPPNGALSTLKPRTPGAISQVGATLLLAATLWDHLARQGLSGRDAAQELLVAMPALGRQAVLLVEAEPDDDSGGESVRVPLSKLRSGMVVGADITTSDGSILLRRGRRLSDVAIEKLAAQPDLRPIQITRATAPTPQGEAVGAGR